MPVEVLDRWKQQLGEEGFWMSPAAAAALSEFGELRVEQRAPGVDMARETFVFDPALAAGERESFMRFESADIGRLFPLGEVVRFHSYLAISETGRVFFVMDGLLPVGSSIEESIRNLVEGRRFSPSKTSPV